MRERRNRLGAGSVEAVPPNRIEPMDRALELVGSVVDLGLFDSFDGFFRSQTAADTNVEGDDREDHRDDLTPDECRVVTLDPMERGIHRKQFHISECLRAR